jgi:cell division protein FtsB
VTALALSQVVLATDMADRATERAESAESLCRQLQQQLQHHQQQQQRLAEKETSTKEQLKHLRSDGDARVIAEREVQCRVLCSVF